MSEMRGLTPSMLRIDTSRTSEYLFEKPKLTFWQKLGRGIGKAMGFLGPIGAAVTAIAVPGFGIPLAAGIYGLSTLAKDATNNALAKDASRMQEMNTQIANSQITLPGLFENLGQSEITTDFIAPSEYGTTIRESIINRQTAQSSSLRAF